MSVIMFFLLIKTIKRGYKHAPEHENNDKQAETADKTGLAWLRPKATGTAHGDVPPAWLNANKT